MKKWILIGVAVLLSVAVGLGIYFSTKKSTPTPTARGQSTKSGGSCPPPPLPPNELYLVGNRTHRYSFKESDAEQVCAQYGANLATKAQLVEAANNGFSNCESGWLRNNPNETGAWYHVNARDERAGCLKGLNNWTPTKEYIKVAQPSLIGVEEARAKVYCYGPKPIQGKGDDVILPWSPWQTHRPV